MTRGLGAVVAFAEMLEIVEPSLDERFLFSAAPFFHVVFTLGGFGARGIRFGVDKHDG